MTRRTPPGDTPRPQRPAGKRASGPPYDARLKARALRQLERGATIAETHRKTGVTKSTLSRWAKAAGIDVGAATRDRLANAAAANEELKLDVLSRLTRVRDYELTALESLAWSEATYAVAVEADSGIYWESGIAGPVAMPSSKDARDALARLMLLQRGMHKRDLVGAVGLLVDKLELLAGKATERGELVVRFGIPRPDFAAADRDAVDLPPLEE